MRRSKYILQLNAEVGPGAYAQLCIGSSRAWEQPSAQLFIVGIPFHDSSFTMDNLQVSNRFSVSFPRSPVSTFRVTKNPHPDVLLSIIHSFPLSIMRSYWRSGGFLTLLRASICRPRAN
ncbi:hypothetical protein M405DRAFT_818329 [Rhizopogon salebrosus TDB-379]|nr:hypothetical protein M405DRAFT_818329 [Rhizopogon salebrosus TDB-379]